MQTWIKDELASVDLGDQRLDRRYELVVDRLSQKPTLSIPAACGGWAETLAAYRFFDNDKVTPDKLLAPHRDATLKRIQAQRVVLLVQDTTKLILDRAEEKVGGPLNHENQYGIQVHPLLALTPEGMALGVVNAQMWARDPDDFHKRKQAPYKPIEEKESIRWLTGYRQACVVAQEATDTQVICISDSEGDVYECFAESSVADGKRKADWIVRACQDDRRLLPAAPDDAMKNLRTAVEASAVRKRMILEVSHRVGHPIDPRGRRGAREARLAWMTVRATTVTLKPPERRGDVESKLPAVTVNVVLVQEENPPAGEAPIEWLLLTSLPIDTEAAEAAVIEAYCRRWEIEVYFRVLKSGCGVEELQFETTERLMACVAVYLIVAWRVLFVMRMGRECPDLPCDTVLSPEEWQSVYTIVQKKPLPKKVPTLGEMIPMIASLGGYLGRKSDGPPGPQAMWIGIQRMRDFAAAWIAFGPPYPPPRSV